MEAVDGDENSDVRIRLGVFAGEIRIVMLLAVGVDEREVKVSSNAASST